MKTNHVNQRYIAALALLSSIILHPPSLFAQGSLTPPGAPAPMMKTLDQIEPRTAITNLPCVIAVPGSYYLTKNLTGVPGLDGIIVQADQVTIDLRGFALIGGGGGGGRGLVAGGRTGLRVCNGSVANWPGVGVVVTNIPVSGFIAVNCQCERLRLTGNGGGGLLLGGGGAVLGCLAVSNGFSGGGYGIQVSGQSIVKDCVAMQNTVGGGFASFGPGSVFVGCSSGSNYTGFFVGGGGRISDCAASFNSNRGIDSGPGCSVSGCTVFYNGADGLFLSEGGAVKDCTAKWNSGNGIEVSTNCYAIGNTCDANAGAGIRTLMGGNRIEGNSVTGNATGIDCSGTVDNFVIRNSAHGNSVAPFNFPVGTRNAPGLTPTQGFNSDQPWVNFVW